VRDIFIGVDGGATKCKVRVEDSHGELLGQAVGGAANIRLSVDVAWQSIFTAIEEVLAAQNISVRDKNFHFHAGVGLAGCEVQEARTQFLNTPHPFHTLHLMTDAHAACVGAHAGRDGAIIIIGTGVIGYEIQNNVGTQVGGWGFPHDDEGGGAWLGLEAARLTFQMLDQRAEKSPLTQDVFAFFDNDLNHFVAWANRANSSEFARLAPLVINHSQQEDISAVRLIKKAALAINRVGAALEKIHRDKNQPLPCSLFGGISPFIEPWLGDELRARLVPRIGDANTGAILLVKQFLTNQKHIVTRL
jgi:glucosamine kinase